MADAWPVVPSPKEEERSIWRAKSWINHGALAAVEEPKEDEWPEVPAPALDERKFWQSASWRKPSAEDVNNAWNNMSQCITILTEAGHELPSGLKEVVEKREVVPSEEEELKRTYLGFKEHLKSAEGVDERIVDAAMMFVKGYDVLKCVYMPLNVRVIEEDEESVDSLGVDELAEMAEILEG